jgi:protein tyrosine phosphatase (PTP) superfamily phosphohydrolase (DUF442 family)
MGIDIVVDTRGNRTKSEGKEVRRHGMQYVAIPWHCPFPKDETFARFLKLMRDNPDKKVFVHCRLGDDRTGMMIAAYRMANRRMDRRRGDGRNASIRLQPRSSLHLSRIGVV